MEYGDFVYFLNQNDPTKGFLEVRGYTGRGCFTIDTSEKHDRVQGSGTWEIVSKSSATGPVKVNDEIHLINQYQASCGYLDVYGPSTVGHTGYGVQTTDKADRAGVKTGTWQLMFTK